MTRPHLLQRLREGIALGLLGLLPFHALLVTVATKLLKGPGHAPISTLALWKEGVLLVLVLIAGWEMARSRRRIILDRIDGLILTLIALGLLVTALTHGNWGLAAFGFKYDFFALCAFLVLRRVPWSGEWLEHVSVVLLWVGAVIAGYGLLTLVLPPSFFLVLGYSDAHSLYLPDQPLASAQYIGSSSIARMQSAMSGPNQLGIWLLLPFSVCIARLRRNAWDTAALCVFALLLLCIILTFSRGAWIAAAILTAVSAYGALHHRYGLPWRWPKRVRAVVVTAMVGVVMGAALVVLLFPTQVVRIASSRDHFERPLQALQRMWEHPLGEGLGTAGPASHRVSDACVFLDEGADASWAKDRPNLCVFTGDTQVQPTTKTCHCAFLPENWYLQIGVETGVIGFVLFVWLIVAVLRRLRHLHATILPPALFLSVLGVSIVALVLHAWEDAAVAYGTWLLLAAVVVPKADA